MCAGITAAFKKSNLLPFLLPVGVALIIPGLLIFLFGTYFWNPYVQIPVGSILIAGGVFLAGWSIILFRRIGRGSLASWNPTQKLVIVGPYAHTRNPMISGVLFVLLGESILCGSLAILAWAFLFFLVNTLYFRLSEEPGLLRRFGDDYIEYRNNVPMWLPKPWVQSQSRLESDRKT
jgi:protein-S-isoprenylcysteine O-methyltransferase Ste14